MIQTISAHQTKLSVINLFNKIKENNHLGRVKIIIVAHDEIQLEVEDVLKHEYKKILETIMVESAQSLLVNKIVNMEAEAVIGTDWSNSK